MQHIMAAAAAGVGFNPIVFAAVRRGLKVASLSVAFDARGVEVERIKKVPFAEEREAIRRMVCW